MNKENYIKCIIVYLIYFIFEILDYLVSKYNLNVKLAQLYKKHNYEKSIYYYFQYFRFNSDDISILIELANFLSENNKIEISNTLCLNGLKNYPDNIDLLLILCLNFLKSENFYEVINISNKILKINNTNKTVYKYLCEAYCRLGMNSQLTEKIKKFNLEFNSIYTLNYLKNMFLKSKNLKDGFPIKKLLLEPKYWQQIRNCLLPDYILKYYKHIWKGENLENKTLFIFYYWSGYGDLIQFCRYIPILQQMTKCLVIEVDDNLLDLYKYNFPNCKIILKKDKEFRGYNYTYHHELFLNLQNNLEIFPFANGYLHVSPYLISKIREIGIFDTNKLKIGLFWQSNSTGDFKRSINIKEIIPILKINKYKFYAISKEEKDKRTNAILKRYGVIDCSTYIKNAQDTASIMKNLDLIVSIDSFPIHLAGALGIKGFLLLPLDSDWRWFDETNKTCLYSSITIFKQTKANYWKDVITKVLNEIKILSKY